MTLVSQSLPRPEWIFPTITNNYEARIAGRKRGLDAEYEGERQEQADIRGSKKKAKTLEPLGSVSNASNTPNTCLDAMAPHEFLADAGDWRYEPLFPDNGQNELQLEEDPPSVAPVDVEKVIAILLQALNAPSPEPDSPAKPYQRPPTSALSNSPYRVPFIRKSVGGSCRGRIDPGLQRWVLSRNHYEDVRSSHPSRRSSEWIEALHEMGWETLHPTYMSQSQQTFKALNTFSSSCGDWIDVDDSRDDHSSDGSNESERGEEGEELAGIHENVWDLGRAMEAVPPQRTVSLLAA